MIQNLVSNLSTFIRLYLNIHLQVLKVLSSSVVEQLAVNQLVVGSNPTWGVYFREVLRINSQSASFMFFMD